MAALRSRQSMLQSVNALEAALRAGIAMDADPARAIYPIPAGQLLVMPSSGELFSGVKLISVVPSNPSIGMPRIHGIYVLMDATTMSPLAIIDAAELTAVRTAAVSAVAIRQMLSGPVDRTVVFGTGPQAWSHIEAVSALGCLGNLVAIGRTAESTTAFVERCGQAGIDARGGSTADLASAQLVICCTSARVPLFDADQLAGNALIVAIGSHEPDAREIGNDVMARASVVVESRADASREAGEVVHALASGVTTRARLIELGEIVQGTRPMPHYGLRVFKSVGMGWEDRVVATALYTSRRSAGAPEGRQNGTVAGGSP